MARGDDANLRFGRCGPWLAALIAQALFGSLTAVAIAEPQPYFASPIGAFGIGRYYPDKWGVAEIRIANPDQGPRDLLAAVSFQSQPETQFGRQMWVPGNAIRTTWCPVLPPAKSPDKTRSWDIRSFLFEVNAARETPIPAATGEMYTASYLLNGRVSPLTGLVADPENSDEMMHLLWAARISRNLSKTIALLDFKRLPPTVDSLDGLDHLLVASNEIVAYPAACAAIRSWLLRGGHLWLHLNSLDVSTVRSLVGDALQVSVIDRVEREQLQVDSHELRVKQPSGPEFRREQPVELMRAVFTNARASHSVDDWTVAAWTSVGRGKLLVTTLGSQAWLRERTPADVIPDEPDERNDHVRFLAAEPLRELASMFFIERARPQIAPREWQDYAMKHIGYEVVSRQKVGLILGLFCTGLALTWYGLAKLEALAHFFWLGPVAVALTSLCLLGMGYASRKAIPKTIVNAEFAEASLYADEVQLSGLMVTYSPDRSEAPLTARDGGLFWPSHRADAGSVLRMIATDDNRWELRNLNLPAGIHVLPCAKTHVPDAPFQAEGTFGSDGLTGTVSTRGLGSVSDAILAMPSTRNLAVELGEGGRFICHAEGALAPGEFLTGALLSDEQRHRNGVFESFLAPSKTGDPYPAAPTLLFWTQPIEQEFGVIDAAEPAGSTLVSIPLELKAPAPGTEVRIPGPFVRYRAAGTTTAATFDERKRSWVGPFSTGLETTLRFQLPSVVLPLNVNAVRLVIGVKALSREMQVVGFHEDRPVVLDSRKSPLGKVELQIDREEVLAVNDAGELTFGINVGDIRDDEGNRVVDAGDAQTWRIDDVQLEVRGTTLAH